MVHNYFPQYPIPVAHLAEWCQRVQRGGRCHLSWVWQLTNLTSVHRSSSTDCPIAKAGRSSFWSLVWKKAVFLTRCVWKRRGRPPHEGWWVQAEVQIIYSVLLSAETIWDPQASNGPFSPACLRLLASWERAVSGSELTAEYRCCLYLGHSDCRAQ